jgi:hypothetical protein
MLDPETGEAEMVPNSDELRAAQWVEDGHTFIARTGRSDWAFYDTDGKLLQTIINLPQETEPDEDQMMSRPYYDPEPISGTDDILIRSRNVNPERRWLFNLQTGENRPLPEFLRDAYSVDYSPDGRIVLFVQFEGRVWSQQVANSDGSNVRMVKSGNWGEGSPPASDSSGRQSNWSPDRRYGILASGPERIVGLVWKAAEVGSGSTAPIAPETVPTSFVDWTADSSLALLSSH